MADRLLRAAEVTARTGLSRTSLWRAERAGRFPARRVIGAGMVAWMESEVQAWIESRPPADSNRAA
jgi:prophage regulatory protein